MTTKALEQLVARYSSLRKIIADAEAAIDKVRSELFQATVKAGGAAETKTHTMKIVDSERRTIVAAKLLERGVPLKTIEACTSVSNVSYLRVDTKKEKES